MTRISRRGLLTSGAAAGVLAASGLPLSASARRGGTLRVGLSGASVHDTWDARYHRDLFMMVAGQGAVFDTLTEIAADGSLRGELATQWQASADARVWTIDLRKGVTFHNGKPFNVRDVIASFQLHLDPAVASPARPIIAMIEDMTALGPHQMQITLHQGNADFPYLLSDYHLLIYPEGQIEAAIARGIGTGLYRVDRFEPGKLLTAQRVGSHYKGDSAGFFDRIELTAVPHGRDRARALMAARVDVIDQVDPALAPKVQAHPGLNLLETNGNAHVSFGLRMSASPLDQLSVRKALKHGIDRETMLDVALGGRGQVAADSPVGPANQYYVDLPAIPYDPDLARYHLRQAGLDRLSLDLSIAPTDFAQAEEAGEVFRASAEAAGIALHLQSDISDLRFERPCCAARWSGRATEDWMLTTAYAAGAPWNFGGWDHPRFQSLLASARSELDSIKRQDIYAELQFILRDEGNMLIPAFVADVQGVSKRIAHGATVGSHWPLDNARLAERWWMA
ncbi:ABC transporter substrate-binding protein [Pseudoprimorskyibacter insulae]|uniref:Heme-binding protein A n=1 Tax=Pseudoprimorskyibacter insulae TaxID=1695997 RepID=A0A2R8AU52_9RHOB|nr:ABC transporter substrate-binding protein [Pseudoprimorskyibacter insulae]SPF79399.1 Heme-binding protein A [Pseudoprimorskyibacter insulae]